MATVQVADQFSSILADLFADVPYVKKLGYDVAGTNVILRAIFDDGDDFAGRLREVGRRFSAFEESMWNGIMPDIELRMQAAPTRIGWPGGLEGMTAVIDR